MQGAGSWANPGDELSLPLKAAVSQQLALPAISPSAATSALGVLIFLHLQKIWLLKLGRFLKLLLLTWCGLPV